VEHGHSTAPARDRAHPQWWHTLGRCPAGAQPARDPHPVDLAAADFLVCESVKHSRNHSRGTDGESFAHVNALANTMIAARGSGFEHVIRQGPDGNRVDPPWLTSQSYVCDLDTGRFAAAAHLNHTLLDLPPGLVLGGFQTHSRPGWEDAPDGLVHPHPSLYLGSTITGVTMPIVMGINVVSVDLWPATGNVALFESWGGTLGAVTILDPHGQRRLLTTLEGVAGGEHIRYSPDGSWLLVDNSGSRSWLVNATTGQWLKAPVQNVGWWPLAPSTLLTVDNDTEAVSTPRLYNLETAAFTHTFPALRLDGAEQTDPDLLHCFKVAVSPDGTELLVGSRVGITHEYQKVHGSRQRVARIDLRTGHGALVWPIFLNDDHELEREHDDYRWLRRPPCQPVTLHPDLAAQLQQANRTDNERNLQRSAYQARQLAGFALQHAYDILRQRPDATDPSPYLPEIIRGLASLYDLGPELWPPVGEWVDSIAATVKRAVSSGLLTGRPRESWERFSRAVDSLHDDAPQRIDWHALPWLTSPR
jgi:hypothetical protein